MTTNKRLPCDGRCEGGSALVELAVVLPLLVMVMAGATDFARVFYTANVLTNAARAGAQYCAQTSTTAETCATTTPAIVQNIATANGLGTLTVPTPTRTCECYSNAGVLGSPASPACTGTCPSSGHVVIHVTVSATKTFSTIFANVPGVPGTIDLTRSATIRAQ